MPDKKGNVWEDLQSIMNYLRKHNYYETEDYLIEKLRIS